MDAERVVARIDRLEAGGGTPFRAAEVEAMSAVISIFAGHRCSTARVWRVWGVARSSVYRLRRAAASLPALRRRLGPAGPMPDEALVDAIRRVLTESPFRCEGYPRSGSGFGMQACEPPGSACAAFVRKSVQ